MRIRIPDDRLFAAVTTSSWALLGILTVLGALLGSGRFAGGILAGGLLALGNYYWLKSVMVRALGLQPSQAGRFAQVRYLLRLAIMALALYVLIVHAKIDIIGLLVGLSVLVIVISGLSLYMLADKGE
ncbi:MAG: ATP synthase subunit I [Desulfuromonadales bacterium]|nr:MAG: ATP synthase subunit I [Desulfuromonadales bacterium]